MKMRMALGVSDAPEAWGSDATDERASQWCAEVCAAAEAAGMIGADAKNATRLYITPDMRGGFVGAFGDAWYEDRETNEHIDPNDVLDIDWFAAWCGFDGDAERFCSWLRSHLA